MSLNNNTIIGCQAVLGAAIGMMFGSPTLSNEKYCNNVTPDPGYGTIYIESANPNIVNSLLANNTASGIYMENSMSNIINTTITNNNTNYAAGMVFDLNSDANVRNCVINGNEANNPMYGNQILIVDDESDPYFDHCNIQDGIGGFGGPGSSNYDSTHYTNNIDADPLFVDPSIGAGAGYNGLTADWGLLVNSPCIDAGDTTGILQLLPLLDLAGNPRINGTIDMGAYEYVDVPIPLAIQAIAMPDTICQGESSLLRAIASGGTGQYTYSWTSNPAGFTSTLANPVVSPDTNTIYFVEVNDGNTFISTDVLVTVNTSLPVSVDIVVDNNPVCSGIAVTFTATPINGGSSPTYQWKKNGIIVGTNSPIYSVIPLNGETINCVLTSDLPCTTGNPATSNAITMIVHASPIVEAGNDQSIAYGSWTVLNGSASGGSGNYSYHWEPAAMLINANMQNPQTINLTSSVIFTLTVTDVATGCTGTDQVMITVTGGPLAVTASANPASICQGETSQLTALVSGGSENYTFSWTSNPVGFVSTLQNPIVSPIITTTYTVQVYDGYNTANASASVGVNHYPLQANKPVGADSIDLNYVSSSEYSTEPLSNVNYYSWILEPAHMGSISGSGTEITITWSGTLGQANLSVVGVNDCGQGAVSQPLIIQIDNSVGIKTPALYDLKIFPNPSTGVFTISSSKSISAVYLYDVSGRIFKSLSEPLHEGMSVTMDYSYLHSGIYFVHVYMEEQIAVRKVVVN